MTTSDMTQLQRSEPVEIDRAAKGFLLKVQKISVNAGLVLFSVFLCLGAVEVFLRITTPREIMRYFFVAPDATLHHRFIPKAKGRYESTEFNTSYAISALGLRDTDYVVPKPAGVFRILMLGDSFTEGDGVEARETFSKQLEARLAVAFGDHHVQVINAGEGSYSPLLEYLLMKTTGLALEPDLVILNYDLSDAYDDIAYTKLARMDSRGAPTGVDGLGQPAVSGNVFLRVKDFVKEHTRLYNFLRVRIERYMEGIRHEGNFSGNILFDKYAMLRDGYQPNNDRDWEFSHRYLLMIRDSLAQRHIDFWVNLYPYGMQASPREWSTGRRFWGFKPDTLYSTWPQDHLQRFCEEQGIPVINMCRAFRDTARSVYPLYWPDNGHWIPRGHQVAAEILERQLIPYLNMRKGAAQHTDSRDDAGSVGN